MPGSGITPQEQTVRTAGSVVRLSAKAFASPLTSDPVELVVSSPRYLLRASVAGRGVGRQYLAVSRGVVFHAISKSQLSLPRTLKCIEAEDIWVSLLSPESRLTGRCT
jgi:hypothetical protein